MDKAQVRSRGSLTSRYGIDGPPVLRRGDGKEVQFSSFLMHLHWRLLFRGAIYRVHMKIYLLTVLYLLAYDFYISAKQSWQVDATEQILQDWSARVCSLGLFSIWISGPTISVAKCCALSLCKTKGCKHLDGKKRCTYIDSHYISTHSITLLPPTFPSIFHLSISSFRHGNLPFFSMNLYTSSIIHVQLHPSSFAKA